MLAAAVPLHPPPACLPLLLSSAGYDDAKDDDRQRQPAPFPCRIPPHFATKHRRYVCPSPVSTPRIPVHRRPTVMQAQPHGSKNTKENLLVQLVQPAFIRAPSAPYSDSQSALAAPTRPFTENMLIHGNSDDELGKTDVFWHRFNASAVHHQQQPDAEKNAWLEKHEGKFSKSHWNIWIASFIIILLAVGGIGVSIFLLFHNNFDNTRPTPIGGATDVTSGTAGAGTTSIATGTLGAGAVWKSCTRSIGSTCGGGGTSVKCLFRLFVPEHLKYAPFTQISVGELPLDNGERHTDGVQMPERERQYIHACILINGFVSFQFAKDSTRLSLWGFLRSGCNTEEISAELRSRPCSEFPELKGPQWFVCRDLYLYLNAIAPTAMWDVRLRPYRDDADVFENNEFAAVFTECCNTTLRQASGGKLGNIYGPYACHQGHTPDDIKALFRHAVDTDIVAEVGGSIHPGLKAQLKAVAESGIKHFGRLGMLTFYCNNYISPIHGDLDIGDEDLKMGRGINDSLSGYYPCIQLEKKNCSPNDYSFAYVRWGVVIETRPNTMWVFNGRHEHSTVMPSQSAMNSDCKHEPTYLVLYPPFDSSILLAHGRTDGSGSCDEGERESLDGFACLAIWHARRTHRTRGPYLVWKAGKKEMRSRKDKPISYERPWMRNTSSNCQEESWYIVSARSAYTCQVADFGGKQDRMRLTRRGNLKLYPSMFEDLESQSRDLRVELLLQTLKRRQFAGGTYSGALAGGESEWTNSSEGVHGCDYVERNRCGRSGGEDWQKWLRREERREIVARGKKHVNKHARKPRGNIKRSQCSSEISQENPDYMPNCYFRMQAITSQHAVIWTRRELPTPMSIWW
ncbi:hypothetical protein B0H17DRAFT_1252143 [Mycena rosella]|uniref:Uncharacterized protein n=1 Tax=Mycena rosella TaxID=1033263 RepID=A0AAD7G794_MYCRO|nr:hypothetical protein B0H17DRAFT_1252143 [Mycena rosella]